MGGRGGRGPGGGRPRGTDTGDIGASRRVSPDFDDNSRLVVRFVCETSEVSKTFIEEQVFDGLRAVQFDEEFAGLPRKAFHRVEMLGDVRDVWRDRNTYELVAGDPKTDLRFVAFEGYAVVNLGEPETAQGAGGAARAGRAGRSSRASRGRAGG
jgi:hypothetical protein